ncbi:hypothetical protein ACLIBG_09205 [Virgibacillus sp. W0181]|uniref:hypothetical protein n=1 Tax=Virgibacillus sp. W0181 TaxID=3391581 RepID=UPI003F46733E
MHIRIPFLAVLIITIFQLTVYGIQNNEHSAKDFNEIMTVQLDNITEISMIDLSGEQRCTKDPKHIKAFVNYFNQFQYKRLRNDQTAFMPKRTMTINFDTGDDIDFIIPYGNEVFISHKTYSIRNGTIEQDELLEMFLLLSHC